MKDYREKELKWYIFAYLFLLIGMSCSGFIVTEGERRLSSIEGVLTSSLLAGVICTLGFVFDCLYTAEIKDALLRFGITVSLPGKTIFTRISKGKIFDMRVNTEKAKEKYGDVISSLPADKKNKKAYENRKWYELSRIYEDDHRVIIAHRDYLLCRDMYTTTITMLLLTIIGVCSNVLQFSWVPIGYLVSTLVLTNVATRARAYRFVNSVIIADMDERK